MENETARLVRLAVTGNSAAFDELVRTHHQTAVRYAYQLLGCRARAEDAAQDAFLQVWRDLPRLRAPAAFGAWLRRIVQKHADRARRCAGVTTTPLDTAGEAPANIPTLATQLIARETGSDVHDIIQASLTDGERFAVTLFYFGGQSAADIATTLATTEPAIKQRLSRARKRLAQKMESFMNYDLPDLLAMKATRFVETARLLRQVSQVLESDGNVLAAYLAPFGGDEGFGAANDAWASLNVHAVVADAAMPALAQERHAVIRRVTAPILWVEAQQNAPAYGYYLMSVYDDSAGTYEVDWYWHAANHACIPADARVLFNRGGVAVSREKTDWTFADESRYPVAIREVWAARTPDEARQEETRNTVHLFYAMWLIAAKYCARDPKQTELPFAEMLGNLLADTRRNVAGGEWIKPEPFAPLPTLANKIAALQTLAHSMTALGYAPPDAANRLLAIIAAQDTDG